jgi:AraC-type DNA-binding domain-containing proteins
MLLASDLVEIRDSRCHGETGHGWTVGAVGTSYEVQVIRHGAYARAVHGAVTLVHSGLAVFSNPGDEVCVAHPVAGGDACSIFRLSSVGLSAIAGHEGEDHGERPSQFLHADRRIGGPVFLQHQLAVQAARRAATDPLMRLMAEERALAFLRSVIGVGAANDAPVSASGSREARNRRGREYVMRVRAVIAQHHHEPLTLAAVAMRVGCSPYHLSRIVTAFEGAPIYQLIIRHRLRHGLERVLGTRDALSSIALDIGFASQSHFGDAFRREFGCPPGAARRMSAAGRFSPRAFRPRAHGIPLHPVHRS